MRGFQARELGPIFMLVGRYFAHDFWLFPLGFGLGGPDISEAARIKDIASIEGVRDNQLIGYGLVVGLDRTGDSVVGGQFTAQAIISMLNTMGINLKMILFSSLLAIQRQ